MGAIEKSAWSLTKDFLTTYGVKVDKIYDKGIPVFNCLKCEETESGIMLTRETISKPPVSFSLEFRRKTTEKGEAVFATCQLITSSPEELRDLRIRDDYSLYNQEGVVRISRVQQVRLLNPRIEIFSIDRGNFKAVNVTTGGVTAIVKFIPT